MSIIFVRDFDILKLEMSFDELMRAVRHQIWGVDQTLKRYLASVEDLTH